MAGAVPGLLISCLLCFVMSDVLLPGSRSAAITETRPEGATQVARIGREFKLKVGRQITFARESLRIKFVAVENDSRCPSGVTCVWAGNAEVLLEVSTRNGRGKRSLKLSTNGSAPNVQEDKYQRYRVKLVELSPYPRGVQKIKAGRYTATLLVSKE